MNRQATMIKGNPSFVSSDARTFYNAMVDSHDCSEATIDDISAEKLRVFLIKAKNLGNSDIDPDTDTASALEQLQLSIDEKITRAAILLFGVDPQRFIYSSSLRIGKFLSESIIQTTDIVTGDLFYQLENAMEILDRFYLLRYIHFEGLYRKDVLEYPYDALREAITNMIMHRNYAANCEAQIRLYPESMLLMNKGELPQAVQSEDIDSYPSRPSNKLIHQMFEKAGLTESSGSGIRKIMEECIGRGLPEPNIEKSNGSVYLTLFKKKHEEKKSDNDHVTRSLKELLQALNAGLSKEELIDILDLDHEDSPIANYLDLALKADLIARTIPAKPSSRRQKYRLTAKGYVFFCSESEKN